ncbi:PfkB family carbohydrate kinase [Thermogemmatispora onikobensis]|uniref:PfkB family carbohydrate kinase n=1 Tax=Thermogemmatispora onikobensis TaxID=732234 RepID=UPI000852DCB8|nr:PfkB family carbohydrate kinase [Thermogemmatispora onikobensis]
MPATILQPARAEPPAFLSIGHITRDVLPDGSLALGGTVTFATLTVERLGLPAALVTCAAADLCQQLPALLPGIGLAARLATTTTTFENRYQDGFRIQYLRARSEPLEIEDIPLSWRAAPIVLLAPLTQELAPEMVALFPRGEGRILAATPQGWLRRWDADGRVWPTPWEAAEQVLPHLDALILSHDDLLPFANGSRAEAEAILRRWSQLVPLLVATAGREGATLFRNGQAQHFPAYAAREVDPTGAGDVFAAAFLVQLARSGDPATAVDFANCVASFSVEAVGTSAIPGPTQVEQRLAQRRRSGAG